MRVLLTGATGFLGMEVLARLLAHDNVEVLTLVRAADRDQARDRTNAVLRRLYEDPRDLGSRLIPLHGDVASDGLGMRPADRRLIAGTTDAVIHCAARVSFGLPREEALNVNAAGTARLLKLALCMRRLERFVHVSTAYVAGHTRGTFGEDDLERGQEFRNSYELSKFEAERTLARCSAELPMVVARPSIVVGDRHTGWTPSFNVIYWPLRAFARGIIRDLPVDPEGIVDVVPVDYVADALVHMLECRDVCGRLHLVAGECALTNGELIGLACRWLGRPAPSLHKTAAIPDEARAYLPYFDVQTSFADARARSTLSPQGIQTSPLPSFFTALMRYAERTHWGKRPSTREAAAKAAIDVETRPAR
jgi:thioester reductase-like protein